MNTVKELSQIDAYRLATDTLNKLYSSEDGKKFVHHLIYAYLATKPKYIIYTKNKLFDCLTKSPIYSVASKDEPLPTDLSDLYSRVMNPQDEEDSINDVFFLRVSKYITEIPKHRVALRSDNTNKLLGTDEYQALQDFIIEQIKSGNKVITDTACYLNHSLRKYIPKKRSKSIANFESKLEKLKAKYNG